MTKEELLSVAEIVEKLTDRFNAQAALHRERRNEYDKLIASMNADHEAKMVEHGAAFGARTEADEKIIEWLRIKVQDARAERDALRAEVAALQERMRALNAVVALHKFSEALKSQTPKHPVKVGEWVRRTKLPGDQSPVGIVKQVTSIRCDGDSYGFADGDFWSVDNCEPCAHQHPAQDGQWVRRTVASGTEPVGTMIQVQRSRTLHSEYVTRGAQVVPWAHCEPCDPPEAAIKLTPKIGDTVRLVTHPERAQVAEHLRTALKWPWMPIWGLVGQTGKVVKPLVAVAGAVAVALDGSTIFARWPIDCLEVVSDATHDTEAGASSAEAALKTEPVTDEIHVALCDARKVTT